MMDQQVENPFDDLFLLSRDHLKQHRQRGLLSGRGLCAEG